MESKNWYLSKIFWLGVINFLIGSLALLGEFLAKGIYDPLAITTLISGILTIILRVWFTNTEIQK